MVVRQRAARQPISSRFWFPGSRYVPEAALFVRRVMGATPLAPPEGPFVLTGPATDVEALKLRHTAATFRRMLDASFQQAQGVIYQLNNAALDLQVKATGTPDGFVHVQAGAATIRGTQAAGVQGMYHLYNDATYDINVLGPNPAHATLDRIDLLVARIQDSFYSGATDLPTLEMVTGTPAGSPVAPAAPANSLILAQLSIIHASSTIPQTVITDRRVPAGRVPIVFDDQSGAGPTASVNIVVPPGFQTLRVHFTGRLDGASAILFWQFNGDTAANYDSQDLTDTNATLATQGPNVATASPRIGAVTASTAVAGAVSEYDFEIQNVDSTTLRKVWRSIGGRWDADAAASAVFEQGHGQWRNVTAAIASILMKPGAGNFVNWRVRTEGIPA